MDRYQKLLHDKGLKATIQRLQILRFLDQNRVHPTIEKIYEALVAENPSMSKTTVYNTIDSLKKHGLIATLSITGKEVLCDCETDYHHHFYCTQCQQVYDIKGEKPFCQSETIQGHRIEEIHGYFKGICQKCLAQTKQKKKK